MLRGNITMANDYEDYWRKKEANTIVKSRYISGLAKESNLDKWANYAKRNSFDQSDSKRQSKADFAPVEAAGRINDWSDDYRVAPKHQEGKGWVCANDLADRNTYSGSKRGK